MLTSKLLKIGIEYDADKFKTEILELYRRFSEYLVILEDNEYESICL